ncbi:molybdopterin dehydrogenase [Thioclava dalianensis]|uniref:Molybdopterin dehydrogenase n=1 Tax=Thioclava dalianensis TaxID=1185766 RepID=A0A074TK34_9RHOB|nr:xanthine dehydrogenase family protein subunit M [Thioclava dalianensis]KEP70535.1 molybdopterin dehydrogenase [Thioclava dalianensis]SFN08008.1 xanthine dehydrogenase YagS FAD-binding subunit [Thioclava dalianensis]
MNRFEYERAGTLAEAIGAEGAFLAGGTNLLDLMKIGVQAPARLVDISRLPLTEIEPVEGGLRIGAMVRNSTLARDPQVLAKYPALAEALLSGASAQLRNAASTGGNVMQATRCSYYQDPLSPCNRRNPGSGCGALGGETRNHAVLGWTEGCIATHPSDMCVALAAYDAVVEISGPEGARSVAMAEFHPLPDAQGAGDAPLAAGEIITHIRLPDPGAMARHARYVKLRERTSFAFAIVSAAAALAVEDGRITQARLALGGVAARPWRCRTAEAALLGQPATIETFTRAAELALEGASPSGANEAKIRLARKIAIRALERAAAGTPERLPALPASLFAGDDNG